MLCPAAVDDNVLRGDQPAVVRGEKERHAREIARQQFGVDALPRLDRRAARIVEPQAALLVGHHPARHERVHANAERPELARERTREPLHRRLRGRVDRIAGVLQHPTDRAEIDDRAAAQPFHVVDHRLRGEELMTQIHRDARVERFGRHVGNRVSHVVRRVVDEHRDRADAHADRVDRAAQRADVGEIAHDEHRFVRGVGKPRDERAAGLLVEIDERDARALPREVLDERRADARRAARDQHRAADEARVACVTLVLRVERAIRFAMRSHVVHLFVPGNGRRAQSRAPRFFSWSSSTAASRIAPRTRY
ncbi:hypothetical protein BURPS1710b_3481 [Burkholderia pseudomallei 1710b]|uniref:Uncharacterized protein n=1 Tax=Burkholderia pseudomallei (strain 1710b) TaxID=320372 RepID=Q3JNK2_BURP1|nr:hypothetical protein BURPS1710b_3481 [Burkholderia pseudomallei 1710b]